MAAHISDPGWGTRAFGEVVEELWAKAEKRRRARYMSLFRQLKVDITYESFRQMITGYRTPRDDVMEQVAAALGIDPREFPEYRMHEVLESLDRHPDLRNQFYDEIMKVAAVLDDQVKSPGDGEQRSR